YSSLDPPMKRSPKSRVRARVRHRLAPYRPHLLSLEDRLPLGDALLSVLVGSSLLGMTHGALATGTWPWDNTPAEEPPAAPGRAYRGNAATQGVGGEPLDGNTWILAKAVTAGRDNAPASPQRSSAQTADAWRQSPLADATGLNQNPFDPLRGDGLFSAPDPAGKAPAGGLATGAGSQSHAVGGGATGAQQVGASRGPSRNDNPAGGGIAGSSQPANGGASAFFGLVPQALSETGSPPTPVHAVGT